MATPVELPELGNTVEECIIAGWRKRKGDKVSAGDVIADIETDKATFDVAAPVDGIVLETFFDEGAVVPVFTNICVIGKPGENIESFRPGGRSASTTTAAPEIASSGVPPSGGSASEPPEGGTPNRAAHAQRTSAAALSPRASRFAKEHNIDPSSVSGSGPGGRVLEEDLRRTLGPGSKVVSAPKPGTSGARPSGVREIIAQRMRASLESTAQYTLNGSADAGGLLRLRAKIKASKSGPDINLNDLVAFCTIKALVQVPDVNAEFINGAIQKRSEVHLAFACDTPRGLLVPVIRDAHKLAIGELATRMKDLAAKAVQGTVSPEDLSGGTFTISNLGGLGVETFTPVLNVPQVAILGVGTIQVRPVRQQGKVEFIDVIGLSLTCDHQVVDGAPGAKFLQVLREKIENVESLCTI